MHFKMRINDKEAHRKDVYRRKDQQFFLITFIKEHLS